MDRFDYYGCLEVDRDASQEEIKRAYRRMVRCSHPDTNPDDADAPCRLRSVIAAYKVLGDPFSRARYDRVDNLFGPRKVPRDEVTERKSAYWEERLYRQRLRSSTVDRRRCEAKKPFLVGLLLLCLGLMLMVYTVESDWFTSNPFHHVPKWRMSVETLKSASHQTPAEALTPDQDLGVQYWANEYQINRNSALARTELARGFARFAEVEFQKGNTSAARDYALSARQVSPDLPETQSILRDIEVSLTHVEVNEVETISSSPAGESSRDVTSS